MHLFVTQKVLCVNTSHQFMRVHHCFSYSYCNNTIRFKCTFSLFLSISKSKLVYIVSPRSCDFWTLRLVTSNISIDTCKNRGHLHLRVLRIMYMRPRSNIFILSLYHCQFIYFRDSNTLYHIIALLLTESKWFSAVSSCPLYFFCLKVNNDFISVSSTYVESEPNLRFLNVEFLSFKNSWVCHYIFENFWRWSYFQNLKILVVYQNKSFQKIISSGGFIFYLNLNRELIINIFFLIKNEFFDSNYYDIFIVAIS